MAADQAPPSLGFSWQEHWSGLPFPSPKRRAQVSKKPHLFAGVLVRNWETFPGQPCLEGARWPQETLGPSAFMLVLSLLFSGDSIHREPTLGQAGLLQALRRPCSSNGPIKRVLLSSLPLNINHVFGCIGSQLHCAGSLLRTGSQAVALGPSCWTACGVSSSARDWTHIPCTARHIPSLADHTEVPLSSRFNEEPKGGGGTPDGTQCLPCDWPCSLWAGMSSSVQRRQDDWAPHHRCCWTWLWLLQLFCNVAAFPNLCFPSIGG